MDLCFTDDIENNELVALECSRKIYSLLFIIIIKYIALSIYYKTYKICFTLKMNITRFLFHNMSNLLNDINSRNSIVPNFIIYHQVVLLHI